MQINAALDASACGIEFAQRRARIRTKDVLPVSLDSLTFCLVSECPAFTA